MRGINNERGVQMGDICHVIRGQSRTDGEDWLKSNDKIMKIENETKKELNKKRKTSESEQSYKHKIKQYCKTDSLFLHLGLQKSDWSFSF